MGGPNNQNQEFLDKMGKMDFNNRGGYTSAKAMNSSPKSDVYSDLVAPTSPSGESKPASRHWNDVSPYVPKYFTSSPIPTSTPSPGGDPLVAKFHSLMKGGK